MTSPYVKAPFPRRRYKRFVKLAKQLGYKQRGQKWELMEKMLNNVEAMPGIYQREE